MTKVLSSLLLLAVLLVASARPAFAAENIFQRINNSIKTQTERFYLRVIPGDKPGEAVYRQSILATQDLKTTQMDIQLGMDLLDGDNSLAKAKMTIAGPVELSSNQTDLTNYKQSLNMAGEVSIQGTSFRGDLDLVMTNEMVYFRVNEAPVLPNIDLSSMKGKWLKAKNTATSDQTKKVYSDEDQKKLKQAYDNFLKASQIGKAKKETKDGKAVYVVESVMPKAAVVTYIKDVIAITQPAMNSAETESDSLAGEPDSLGIDADTQAAMMSNIEKGLEYVGEIKSITYFDRATFLPIHAEVPLVITLPARPERSAVRPGSGQLANFDNADTIKVNIVINFDNFNQPIEITEPTDAQDAEVFFSELMQQGMLLNQGGAAGSPTMGTSELPTLTPYQQSQLQQYQQMQNQYPGLEDYALPNTQDMGTGY